MSIGIKRWFLSSLARNTMLKMGLRVTVIISTVALLSYWHIYKTLEQQTYDNLQNYITELGQKESAIFLLAEDNHRVFKEAFLTAWPRAVTPSKARLEALFFDSANGVLRMRAERFNGVRRSDGTISRYISAFAATSAANDELLHRKLLLSYDLIDRYAEAWAHRFASLYVTMPENAIMIYWPQLPWATGAAASLDVNKEEWGYISDLAHNPSRQSVWTGLFYDVPAQEWIVSVKTPIDVDGITLLDVGHDILLNDIFERVNNSRLKGTYNFIFRGDGRLIAHPALFSQAELVAEAVAGRTFQIADLGDPQLEQAAQLITASSGTFDGALINDELGESLLAVARIQGPDWYFVTVYPKSLITSAALNAAYFIFLLGLFAIFLEVLMLYLVLSKQVINPLDYFLQLAHKISRRDFDLTLGSNNNRLLERTDEIGVLGKSLHDMANTIQTYDERLEHEVEERTRDLNDANQSLLSEIDKRQLLEEKLREQINIDALTGVYGRSYFLRLGEMECKRSKREGSSIHVVMIDIDFFKNINDTYGHPAGDAVLKQFAHVCQQCLREVDVFGRLGGEEFALVLVGVDEHKAFAICERIRESLEQTEIITEAGTIKLTASFGCAQLHAGDTGIAEALNRADQALYEAKGGGRNQVVMKPVS